jgi:hypothetical protein
MLRRLFSSFVLLAWCSAAFAQVIVQPTASRSDGAFVCAFAASPVAVNQQETVTCTPPAGMFVYITGLSFDVCTDGTGTAANTVTWTSTNLTNAPVWSFSIAATASICQHFAEPLTTPLKSAAPGTAVTLVSPAAALHNSYHARVYAYFAP